MAAEDNSGRVGGLRRHLLEQTLLAAALPDDDCGNVVPVAAEDQAAVLAVLTEDALVREYPPPVQYVQRFLKRYLQLVEHASEELCEGLLEYYLALQAPGAPDPNEQPMFRTLFLDGLPETGVQAPRPPRVTLRYQRAWNQVGQTFWPAGFLLAEYLIDERATFGAARCLELGSGLGLSGVVLDWIGCPRAVCTDFQTSVLAGLRQNLGINKVAADRVQARSFDWRNMEARHSFDWCDYILAADCCYDTDLCELLAGTLADCLAASGPECVGIVAQSIRTIEIWESLIAEFARHNLVVSEIEAPPTRYFGADSYDRSNLKLLRIVLRGK